MISRLLLSTLLLLAPQSLLAVTIEKVTPSAVLPGKTTTITIRGKDLIKARSLWLSFPAKVAIDKKKSNKTTVVAKVTVAEKTPVQLAALRVITGLGASNARLILVDDLPTTINSKTNHSRESAHSLSVGSACDGYVPSEGRSWFRLQVKAKQRVSLEVFARRLGSSVDATIDVLNAQGKLVASADDTVGLAGDCRLSFEATPGLYWVAIRDSEFRGGTSYRYRLRCGDFPLVSSVYPLSAARGQKLPALILGAQSQKTTIEIPKTNAAIVPFGLKGRVGSALGRINAVAKQEQVEREPNNTLNQARQVTAPGAVSGRFEKRGDVDWFKVKLPAGRVRIAAMSRRYGLQTMVLLRLCKENGEATATAFTTPPNPAAIETNITSPGMYYVRLEELHRRSGPALAYRLVVQPAKPKFDVQTPGRLSLKPGKTTNVAIQVERLSYRGPIELSLQGNTKLKIVGERTLGPKQKKITLKVSAAKDLKPGTPLVVKFVGQGIHEELLDAQLFEAEKYNRGNLGIFEGKFISDKMGGLNYAEYDVTIPTTGRYRLELRFAAKASRPATLKLDGKVVTNRIMSETTGGWTMKQQRWHPSATLILKKGKHVLRLERNGTFSHLDKFRISRIAKAKRKKIEVATTGTATAALKKQLSGVPYLPETLTNRVIVTIQE